MSILTLCPFKTPMDRIWSRLAKKFCDLRSSKISSRNLSSFIHFPPGRVGPLNFHPFENVMPVKLGFPLLKDRGENKQMFETTTYLDTLGVFSYWASGSESKSNSEKKTKLWRFKGFPMVFWFFLLGHTNLQAWKKMDGRVGISSAPFCVGFKTICYILLQWLVNRDAYNIVL